MGSEARFRHRAAPGSGGGAWFLEWGVYLVVALVMMWPATFRLTEEFVGWRDANYYMWLSWRLGELIQSWDIFSLRLPDIVYPVGVDLKLIDGLLPSLLGGIFNLFASPILAFNLTLVAGTLLNLWGGSTLARSMGATRAVAIIVAIAFATAPALALRMTVHQPMYFAFTVPLLLAEAIRALRNEESVSPIRLVLLLFAAYLCSIYFFVFGILAFLIVLIVGTVGKPAFKKVFARVGVAFLLTGIVMSPFIVARLSRDRAETEQGGQPVLLKDSYRAAGDALSVIAQPEGSTIDLPGASRLRDNFRDDNVHESTLFPGFLLLLGLVGLVVWRTRLSLGLGLSAVALWILSLGPSLKVDGSFPVTGDGGAPAPWLPYSLLLKFPGLGSLRSANRISFTLVTVLTACVAYSLVHLFRSTSTSARRAVVMALCGLLLVTNLILPLPTSDLSVTTSTESALRAIDERSTPGDSVLLVPSDCVGESTWAVKLQIFHRTPWVGCQTSASALPWYSGLDSYAESAELASLRCKQKVIGRRTTSFTGEETFDQGDVGPLFQQLGVRFYVVAKDLLERPGCRRRDEVVDVLRGMEVLGEDDEWIVVDARPA